ncbi:MAG: serine hydrolase domain-containing protein [Planctomycetota bacterium]
MKRTVMMTCVATLVFGINVGFASPGDSGIKSATEDAPRRTDRELHTSGESQTCYDKRFDEVRASVMKSVADGFLPSVAIAVAKDGKIIWEEAFGWADKERKIKATPRTPYALASLSKTFTATAVMILVEQGKIDLEKPINDYLGSAKLTSRVGSAEVATVRRILNHRAGLPPYCDFLFEGESQLRRSIRETIHRYGVLTYEPGICIYSNLGYVLLANVISRVSDTSYAQFVRDEVLIPLGMNDSYVVVDSSREPGTATAYNPQGQPIPGAHLHHGGSAGVHGSAHDMVRFGMFHLKNDVPGQKQILTRKSIAKMQYAYGNNTRYGLGWSLDVDWGYRNVNHAGDGPGASAILRLVPSENIALVVLMNNSNDLLYGIQNDILAALIPEWPTMVQKHEVAASNETENAPQGPPPIPREFEGVWRGKIAAYDRDIGIEMTIEKDTGIRVKLQGQEESTFNITSLDYGVLFGTFSGTIPTEDSSRFPHNVRLVLVQRGNTLSGQATAFGRREDKDFQYELSSWVELSKIRESAGDEAGP